MTKILIVGYSGLVGKEIVKTFSNLNYDVYGLNTQTSSRTELTKVSVIQLKLAEIEEYEFSVIILSLQNVAFKNNTNAFFDQNSVFSTENAVKNYLFLNPNCKLVLLSSVAVYGSYEILDNIYLPPNRPSHYGIYKSMQEEIFKLKPFENRFTILRLPAVLCKDSVNHFPARVISNLKQNKDVYVCHPAKLWNSCLTINDLVNIILKIFKSESLFSNVIVPHASGTMKILDVVTQMKLDLDSDSKILITKTDTSEGVANILVKSNFETMNVEESIYFFTRLNI
jgi:nucleoside-diphosphate-sugar epimerase